MKYGRSKEGHRVLKQFDGWSEEEIKQYCIQKAMLDNIDEDEGCDGIHRRRIRRDNEARNVRGRKGNAYHSR